MKKARVIVTGGSGYVGSRLAVALAKTCHVTAVDIVEPEKRDLVFPASVEFRRADLRKPAEARSVLADAHLVVHLASDIGSMNYMKAHKADIITNISAIDAAVYPALVANNIPWVIYSSSSMVFQHASSFPYAESDIAAIRPPSNTYGFAKLLGEYFCRAYAEQYGLNYTIIRYHNVFGPGEDSKGASPGDIHVIPALLEKVLPGQYPLEFLGDDPEKATRPFVYVDDAVEASVLIAELALQADTRVSNQDFNIGNDTYYTILELGKKIWELYGNGRPFSYTVKKVRSDTALRREVDIRKMRALGWEPKTTLEEGLAKTADWLRGRSS